MIVLFLAGCQAQKSDRAVPVIRLTSEATSHKNNQTYIVRKGDTIYSIAWHFGIDFRELAQYNHIDDHYMISPGQELIISYEEPPIKHPSADNKANRLSPNKRKINNKQAEVKVKSQQYSVSHYLNKEKKSVTKWIWPVKGKLVEAYSASRGGNKGIDIATSGPKAVHAIADGVVVYSGEGLRGYGKLVIVKHNENFLSAYAYNSEIRVKEKNQVKVGEHIADTGEKGLLKNRLHLEIRYKGKPVNPLIYLKQ